MARPPFGFSPARLRLAAAHPLFEDGDVRRHLSLRGGLSGGGGGGEEEEDAEEGGGGRPSGCSCHAAGCSQVFASLESYEHHYNLLHRSVCSTCKRSFPSTHLLDIHLLEWHDSLFQVLAERRKMYQCLVESCPEKFKNSTDRKDHLIKIHRYPSDFRFDKPMKSNSTTVKSPSRDHTVAMDVNVEASESSPGDAMEIGSSETVAEKVLRPGTRDTWVSTASETQHSRTRVPSSICFGQGATRGFQSRKKRA